MILPHEATDATMYLYSLINIMSYELSIKTWIVSQWQEHCYNKIQLQEVTNNQTT